MFWGQVSSLCLSRARKVDQFLGARRAHETLAREQTVDLYCLATFHAPNCMASYGFKIHVCFVCFHGAWTGKWHVSSGIFRCLGRDEQDSATKPCLSANQHSALTAFRLLEGSLEICKFVFEVLPGFPSRD